MEKSASKEAGKEVNALNGAMALRQQLAAIGVCLLWLFPFGCGFRAGNRVLIPEGYVGWVRIYYGETGAPRLPMENGKLLIAIDKSGEAHTSVDRETGYGSDEYFYVSSAGSRTKLKLRDIEDHPDDIVHEFTYQSPPKEVTMFFVGPRTAVREKPRPDIAAPI